ncbi:MAG: glycosyltransferase family 39 protein [Planctomycetes bacterium]|nr:glycosyltransferase family 39 protein [Planctomycetota bacterium]
MAAAQSRNTHSSSNTDSTRRTVWTGVVCGVILVAAGIVRFYASLGDFWFDEIWSWYIARNVLTDWDILTSIHHDNNHHLNTWFMYLLGQNQHWTVYRIPSVMAGIGTVAVAGLIGNRHGKLEAVTAMLLTAGSYLQVHYSSEARGYSTMIFFALLSFYLLDKCLKGARPETNVFFAIIAVLGFLSHLQFVFCYAGLVSWSLWRLIFDRKNRRRLVRINLRCHLIPIVFVSWLYYVDISQIIIGGGPKPHLGDVLVELLSLTAGGPSAGPVALMVAVAVVLATLFALFLIWRNGSDEWVFHLTAILIAPVLISVVMQHTLIYVRYFLVCSMFALLLVNHALTQLVRFKPVGRPLFVVILLGMLVSNSVHVSRLIRLGRGHYQQAIRMINDRTQGPLITIGSDHPFRNPMILRFYQQHMTNLKPIAYLQQGQGPTEGPEWFIRHEFQREQKPDFTFTDSFGNRYQLIKEFPSAGLSGWNWAVYHNEK